MPLETLIARWVAVLWIAAGLSHALYPRQWANLLMPLRDRETGGFILAAVNFPIGLLIILGHNVWVLDIPVIITIAGWLTTIKSAAYLLIPGAHRKVMAANVKPAAGFRIVGIVLIGLGALTGYDAFWRR